jgi:hypothetical protein
MSDLSKRNKANNDAGKRWQRDLLKHLREVGFDAEPGPKAGATKDEGDTIVRLDQARIVIEAKNEKRVDLAGYVTEATREAVHYAQARTYDVDKVLPLAVIKRRMAHTGKAYAVVELDALLRFLRAIGA